MTTPTPAHLCDNPACRQPLPDPVSNRIASFPFLDCAACGWGHGLISDLVVERPGLGPATAPLRHVVTWTRGGWKPQRDGTGGWFCRWNTPTAGVSAASVWSVDGEWVWSAWMPPGESSGDLSGKRCATPEAARAAADAWLAARCGDVSPAPRAPSGEAS